MTILLHAALLLLLVAFAADAYRVARAKEAKDRADQMRHASQDAAMTDMRGMCWQCTAPARMLELVDTGRRYDLLCASCAAITKAMTAALRQERAA